MEGWVVRKATLDDIKLSRINMIGNKKQGSEIDLASAPGP